MLKKILIGLAAVIVLFLVYVAFQPADYHFQRDVMVAAPPEAIFPHLNNTKKMNSWNPFVKMDQDVKITYEGPEEGVGAISTFEGKNVGTGKSRITESLPPSLVRVALEFKKPFEGTQVVEFTLEPQGKQTKVVWAIHGRNSFLARIVCTFMSMDKMMGDTFEKGLADLKALVEAKK